jgi:subtilisin family serine protease
MLWWIAAAHAADDTFFPGPGAEIVSFADLERAGAVRGRSGRILARAADPDAIAALPEVAAVVVLPGGVVSVRPRAGVDDLALSRALHGREDVEWAHPDVILDVVPTEMPDDPFVTAQWHLENTGQEGRIPDLDIDAETAWAYATGAGQLIAVLDSGVQLDHPDLRVTAGEDYVERDGDPSPGPYESDGHGTCAAGVAAAAGGNGIGVAGVAYDAEIYAIRLFGENDGVALTAEDTYEAFVEAVDAGASVLSNSWGWSGCWASSLAAFEAMYAYAEAEGRGGRGAVVVISSGNEGCDIDEHGFLAHETPIVVGAIEGDGRLAYYSNFGETLDLVAPTALTTTDMTPGGYGSHQGADEVRGSFGGTSASAPVVSGTVALMIEANPRLTAAEIREVFCDTAARVDPEGARYDESGRSVLYGCGRIDAGAAVMAVANAEPLAPVPIPVERSYAPRAVLSWEPAADPDGDVQAYVVRWSRNGEPEVVVETEGTSLDVGPEIEAGDVVSWRVRAVDAWGPGPWSDVVEMRMVAPDVRPAPVEEPARGCSHASPAGWLGIVGLLAARIRRAGS